MPISSKLLKRHGVRVPNGKEVISATFKAEGEVLETAYNGKTFEQEKSRNPGVFLPINNMERLSLETLSLNNNQYQVSAKDSENNQDLGMAVYSVNSKSAIVESIEVEIQGQGIGSEIFQTVIENARKAGADYIVGQVYKEFQLHYDAVCAFYKKHGATVDEDGVFFIDLTEDPLAK